MGRPCKYVYVGPGSWKQDLGSFLRSSAEFMSNAERTLLRIPSAAVKAEPTPRPVCQMFDRCEGCPYPAHGFVCWGPDESCLRSEMQKICTLKEEITQ